MAKRRTLLFDFVLTNCIVYLCFCLNAFKLTTGEQHQHQHRRQLLQQQQQRAPLETAKQWKLFTYDFPQNAPVNDQNFYNPTNILATGIAVDRDRIFIATPKLFSGVSSTVNYILKADFNESPVLRAYPDWSFSVTARTNFNCSDLVLVSVYRLRIDSCHRLWVLDAGVSRSIEDYEITCPPKILVIDLNTNRVVRRVDFPREVLRGESLFTNLIIDETTSKSATCDDAFVYISDTVEPAIVVYDSGRDVTWRLTHPAMYPDPDFAQGEILNDRFVLMDGVVGLTFDDQSGIVYFQPFATDRVFSVTREALRAGPLAQNQQLDVKLVGKKASQGIGLAISPIDRSLIFSSITETAIGSWNPRTNQQSVVAYDRERLQFIADITTSFDKDAYLYILSSRFQRFFLKNVNPNEVHNRILRIRINPSPTSATSSISPNLNPYRSEFSSFSSNFANFADYDPLVNVAEHSFPFNGHYQTNLLDRIILPGIAAVSAPKSPAVSASFDLFQNAVKHPYNYEPVGLINYSLRNPFIPLNQGESFPPRKELRNPPSIHGSFIEGLAASPTPSTSPLKPQLNGYRYERGF